MGHYEGRCPLGEPRQASPCGGHQHQWSADASPNGGCQGQRGTPYDVPLSSIALKSLWSLRGPASTSLSDPKIPSVASVPAMSLLSLALLYHSGSRGDSPCESPLWLFLTRACPNKSERLRRLSLRFTWIKLARVNAPAWRAAFGLSRGWFVCRLSTRLATRLSTGLAM